MRLLDQATMARVFAVTDEVPLDREALQVELLMAGDGDVHRTPRGEISITLPDCDDLEPFLTSLPDLLRPLLSSAAD